MSEGKSLGELLAAADAARDSKDWPVAAHLYEQFLEGNAEDAPIWVQFGHAAKESGALSTALAAYSRAIELVPDVADFHLQLGHALKLAGRFNEAVAAYRRALGLDPSNTDVRSEIERVSKLQVTVGSSHGVASATAGGPGAVFLDVTDLVYYLKHHSQVSGIQRVETRLIESILSQPGHPLFRRCRFCIVKDFSGATVHALNDAVLLELVRELAAGRIDDGRRSATVDRLTNEAFALVPRASDVYFILGAFWAFPDISQKVAQINATGARTGIYLYDIIPISHPQFCLPGLTITFARCLTQILTQIDFALTISSHAANELEGLIRKNAMEGIPIAPVILAQQMDVPPYGQQRDLSPEVEALRKQPFVLCVGTLEPRKNHAYLLNIWQRLIDDGIDVPRLVFVGRWGWGFESLAHYLSSTNMLDGKVVVLTSISDPELATLYEHALFTTLPSFVEGWGLPIGESLMYGKVPVCSRLSSMPEVGGSFAQYFDPFDLDTGVGICRDLLLDVAKRHELEKRIATDLRPRTWGQVAADLIDAINQRATTGAKRPLASSLLKLPSGKLAFLGLGPSAQERSREPKVFLNGLMLSRGWGRRETWGAIAAATSAELVFLPDCVSGPISVFLKVRFGADLIGGKLQIRWSGGRSVVAASHEGAVPLKLDFQHEQGTPVHIVLEAKVPERKEGSTEEAEQTVEDAPESFAFAIEGVGVAKQGELVDRLNVLEQLTVTQDIEQESLGDKPW